MKQVGKSMDTIGKVSDIVINSTKALLGELEHEISLFTRKLEEHEANKEDDVTLVEPNEEFPPRVSLSKWLKSRTEDYSRVSREPNIGSIFLIRFVLQILCDGPLSERDIKLALGECCREINIRTTNRGMIAGQNLDVNVACGVLAAVGIIIPDIETNNPNDQAPVPSIKTASQITKIRQQYFCNPSGGSDNNSSSSSSQSKIHSQSSDILAKELAVFSNFPSLEAILRSIDTKYRPQLLKYYEDIRSSPRIPVPTPQPVPLQTSADGLPTLVPPIPTAKAISIAPLFPNGQHSLSDLANGIHNTFPSTNTSNLPTVSTLSSSLLASSQPFRPVPSSNTSSSLLNLNVNQPPLPSPILNTSTNESILSSLESRTIQDSTVPKPSIQNVPTLSTKPKRVTNVRYWRLNPNLSPASQTLWTSLPSLIETHQTPLYQPNKHIFSEWLRVEYEEQMALEQEEMILRALAGKANIPLSFSPYRSGTSFLLKSSSSSSSQSLFLPFRQVAGLGSNDALCDPRMPFYSSGGSVSNLGMFRTGFQFTANQLRDKMKRNSRKRKHYLNSLTGSMNDLPSYYDTNASSSSSAVSNYANTLKKGRSFSSQGSLSQYSGSQTAYIGKQATTYPMVLRSDYSIMKPMQLQGSIFAAIPLPGQAYASTASYDATICMPDLVIRTAEIPWSSIAAEFVIPEEQAPTMNAPSVPVITQASPRISNQSAKKDRKFFNTSSSDLNGMENGNISNVHTSNHQIPSNHVSKQTDVLAPSFRITTSDDLSNDDSKVDHEVHIETEAEDISDMAVGNRHERVLKRMRDDWQLLQRLRLELKHGVEFDEAGNIIMAPGQQRLPAALLQRHQLSVSTAPSTKNRTVGTSSTHQSEEDLSALHDSLNSNISIPPSTNIQFLSKKRLFTKAAVAHLAGENETILNQGPAIQSPSTDTINLNPPRKRGRPSKQSKQQIFLPAFNQQVDSKIPTYSSNVNGLSEGSGEVGADVITYDDTGGMSADVAIN